MGLCLGVDSRWGEAQLLTRNSVIESEENNLSILTFVHSTGVLHILIFIDIEKTKLQRSVSVGLQINLYFSVLVRIPLGDTRNMSPQKWFHLY